MITLTSTAIPIVSKIPAIPGKVKTVPFDANIPKIKNMLNNNANCMSNELIQLRHWLHAYPELSGVETKTAEHVAAFIGKLHPDKIVTNIGGNGVLVLFDSNKPGKTILFRSELDALPIQEINKFAYRSVTDGISHKCGHDGHTTILCGLAEKLSAEKPLTVDDPKQRQPDITLAKKLLNWEPKVGRAEGLKITYQYFKSLPQEELYKDIDGKQF